MKTKEIISTRFKFKGSVPELSQKARAPLRLSIEGVGELIAPNIEHIHPAATRNSEIFKLTINILKSINRRKLINTFKALS